jgi:DNA ligase-1
MNPLNRRHFLLTLGSLSLSATLPAPNAQAGTGMAWRPQLAREARPDIDPRGYLVSEKLDGVRALWDGQQLRFRSGGLISAPPAFTAALPPLAMDGELWLARGAFETLVGTVRTLQPDDTAWRGVTYQVFDLPTQPGPFAERAAALSRLAGQRSAGQTRVWAAVEQHVVADNAALGARLHSVVAAGGEGLMLHRADAVHLGMRSGALLKLKPTADAEAQVLAHVQGKGKHHGRSGALQVRCSDGHVFNLGTGFSDAQRADPPAIGRWVTFTYNGRTEAGVPRFARFLRVRDL